MPAPPWNTSPAAPARGTRPRNRRQLILASAAELFVRDGYSHVSMIQLAESVAVRPSALYQHFRGKEDLLYNVVHHELSAILGSLDGDPGEESSLDALIASTLDHRFTGVLWQRESRHLDPELRAPLRALLLEIHREIALIIRRRRPALTAVQSDLLTWALADALMSVSFQRIELPRTEYAQLLSAISEDVIRTRLPSKSIAPSLAIEARADATRRDELLTVAARLFAERGYQTVGIDDVGAAAGISGPSVYKHFDSKLDLLVTLMLRSAQRLQAQTSEARERADDSHDALNALIHSYTRYTLTHHDLVDLLITEAAHLPRPERDAIIDAQRSYVAQWIGLQQQVHPGTPNAHAHVRLQAFLSVTNDIARTPHLRKASNAFAAVCAIGRSIFRIGPPTEFPARKNRRPSPSRDPSTNSRPSRGVA